MTKIVISVFERIKLIVISCGEIKDKLLNRILKKQKSCQNLKIILLCGTATENFVQLLGNPKHLEENIKHCGLSDHTFDSQDSSLTTSTFKFQGFDTKLKNIFFDEESKKMTDPEMLLRIMKKEEVSVGKAIPISTGYEPKLYTDREVCTNIFLEEKLISSQEQHEDCCIVAKNSQEFNKCCVDNSKNNVHWLGRIPQGLHWKKPEVLFHGS